MKCFDRKELVELLVKSATEEPFEPPVNKHLRECDRCRRRFERGLRLLEALADEFPELPAQPHGRQRPII